MINLLSLKSLYYYEQIYESHNIHHYDHLTMKRLNQYERSDSNYDRLNHAKNIMQKNKVLFNGDQLCNENRQ